MGCAESSVKKPEEHILGEEHSPLLSLNVLPTQEEEKTVVSSPALPSPPPLSSNSRRMEKKEEEEEPTPPYAPHQLHSPSSSSRALDDTSTSSSSSLSPKLNVCQPLSRFPRAPSPFSKNGAAFPKKRRRSHPHSRHHQPCKKDGMSFLLQEYLDASVKASFGSSSTSFPQLFHMPSTSKHEGERSVRVESSYPSSVGELSATLRVRSPQMGKQMKEEEAERHEEERQKSQGRNARMNAGEEEEKISLWTWWDDKVNKQFVTKDNLSRERLLGIQNLLQRQHAYDPQNVELDLSRCYLERSALRVISKFFTFPDTLELSWVTSLRLDGNFFTDEGFWILLSSLREGSASSVSGCSTKALPYLKELYLNHTAMDHERAAALMAILFPIHRAATIGNPLDVLRIGNNVATLPSFMHTEGGLEHLERCGKPPSRGLGEWEYAGKASEISFTELLFPHLTTLSLSDNEALGLIGFVHILRSLIATHYYSHELFLLDLCRCGIEADGVRYVDEFFQGMPVAHAQGYHPVIPHRILLSGNPIAEYFLGQEQHHSEDRYCERYTGAGAGSGRGGERVLAMLSLPNPPINLEI